MPRIRPRVGRERCWRARTREVGGEEWERERRGDGISPSRESHECRSTFRIDRSNPAACFRTSLSYDDDLEANPIIESSRGWKSLSSPLQISKNNFRFAILPKRDDKCTRIISRDVFNHSKNKSSLSRGEVGNSRAISTRNEKHFRRGRISKRCFNERDEYSWKLEDSCPHVRSIFRHAVCLNFPLSAFLPTGKKKEKMRRDKNISRISRFPIFLPPSPFRLFPPVNQIV